VPSWKRANRVGRGLYSRDDLLFGHQVNLKDPLPVSLWFSRKRRPMRPAGKGSNVRDIAPLRQIDDGRLFNQLPVWAPDANVRRTILVENPARPYGF
jgi:hypothetical protein